MKKVNLTNGIYIVIMIVVFLLGSCSTSKKVVPAPKSTCCKVDGKADK